jgi:hypothetical protein
MDRQKKPFTEMKFPKMSTAGSSDERGRQDPKQEKIEFKRKEPCQQEKQRRGTGTETRGRGGQRVCVPERGEWRREAAQCTRGGREGGIEKRNWLGGERQGGKFSSGTRSGASSKLKLVRERKLDDMVGQRLSLAWLHLNKRDALNEEGDERKSPQLQNAKSERVEEGQAPLSRNDGELN